MEVPPPPLGVGPPPVGNRVKSKCVLAEVITGSLEMKLPENVKPSL